MLSAESEIEAETPATSITADTASTTTTCSSSSSQAQFVDQVGHLRVLHLLTSLLDKYTEVLEIQVAIFSTLEHLCSLPDVEVYICCVNVQYIWFLSV